ncbi:MAG: cyclic nucleotide-binding domain-containing protein [Pseudomonadota bacterium]
MRAPRTLPGGHVLFRESEGGNRAYIVEDGEIEIAATRQGRRAVLGTIGPGGIFGEMARLDEARLDDRPRMAEAVARRETLCVVVSGREFHARIAKADPFVQLLLRIFLRNVRAPGTQV